MNLSRMSNLSLLLAASLVLAGCFATPLRSIPRLMRLDFATRKMDEVRAGLRLPEMLRVLPIGSSELGPVRQIVYGVILVTFCFMRPRGLVSGRGGGAGS